MEKFNNIYMNLINANYYKSSAIESINFNFIMFEMVDSTEIYFKKAYIGRVDKTKFNNVDTVMMQKRNFTSIVKNYIYKLKCLTHSYKCDLEKFILCLYVCDILSVNQYNYLYAKLQEFEKNCWQSSTNII